MTGGDADGREHTVATLLTLVHPDRLILVGPAGRMFDAALLWARQNAGVTMRRQADAAGARPGDLLVCEHAGLLPDGAPDGIAALIPSGELQAAALRGWKEGARSLEDASLVRSPAVTAPLELRLAAYARARLAVSGQLGALGGDLNGTPPDGARASESGHRPLPARSATERLRAPDLSIVIPVHNAAPELRRCLHSIARHTTMPCELVLIDDASVDPEVEDVLAEAAGLTGVRILRNAVNLGFTATVNRALRSTVGDVVLLNSDTEVGPRWLEHLVRAARSRHGVATVTPVSDNAGAYSVPRLGEANATPLNLDLPGVSRLIAQTSGGPAPAPTGNGFCMYMSRRAIDEVGPFDADAFPRGYGEENDFCLRASRAGWTHLVDGRTFVHHVREASFGAEKSQLARVARMRIDDRYPEYTDLVREFVSSPPMLDIRARVDNAYREGGEPRPRIMSVIHEGGGGTWIANLELMRALEREWDPFVLTSDRRTVRVWQMSGGELVQRRESTLDRSIRVTDYARADYAELVRAAFEDHEIELVHVRHLFKHTFDAPRIASQLGIPVVFSFHDFYFTCPTVNLLDDHDVYCAAQCTPGDGVCRIPASAGLEGLPHLKHSYVYQWREEVESMLAHADALVTTSEHARTVHVRTLPTLANRPFELIEHGRMLRQQVGINVAPEPGGPIRILIVANLEVHKGAGYIRALRAADERGRLEFHVLGAADERFADLGVLHGPFAAGELPSRAAAIAPAFIGCLSIVPETYCHTLTEAWAMGVPVIATDIGALGERLRAHGGGTLVPLADPSEAVKRIYEVADDPTQYRALREQASLRGCASVADMTDDFAALYRRVLDSRRSIVATGGARAGAALARGVVRLRAVVPGSDGVHPGSTYVRIVQRYRHPSVSSKLSLSLRRADQAPLARDADVVLVQRTALEPAMIEEFIATLEDRGTPLVLDLDDHLLIKSADDVTYGPHQAGLARLIDSASLVLVSSERLGHALEDRAQRVALVPNLIDERLFLSGVRERPDGVPEREGPLQLVYVGSPTHADDLALLRPVLAELDALRPGKFELNVVGVELPGPEQEWYRRVVVPDDCKPYPRFVAWLRGMRDRWDLAVAPLVNTEFNSYKSDLKFLEYGALGLPAVFSDVPAYESVVDGRTGLKAGESVRSWADALARLADDPAERAELADQAFREVTAHRLMRHGSDELIRIVCAVVADPRATTVPIMAA
jgi:GT2 family glycosyltransferase/glycosyltransferase involved in cell wall biosynthesis